MAKPGSRSILIVHRDEFTARGHAELFRRRGFDVLQASSGQQALKLLNLNRPDLVLVDIDLPDMNGLDVSHEIKTDPRLNRVRVILSSARFNTPRDQLLGLEAGKADVYLSEPFKSEELLSVAVRLLTARPSSRTARRTGRKAR